MDFLDAALDPFEDEIEKGRKDGKAAGARKEYEEGRRLGRLKGWEFMLELGFYSGFARSVLTVERRSSSEISDDTCNGADTNNSRNYDNTVSSSLLDSVEGSSRGCLAMISEEKWGRISRTAEGMLSNIQSIKEMLEQTTKSGNCDELDSSKEEYSGEEMSMDVLAHEIQRVRSKYKLLVAQMGIVQSSSTMSFKNIMAMKTSSINNQPESIDSNW